MSATVDDIKGMIRHIENELTNLKDKIKAIELAYGESNASKAAEEWLLLIKKARGKWPSDSPSSVEISRAGRRHARG